MNLDTPSGMPPPNLIVSSLDFDRLERLLESAQYRQLPAARTLLLEMQRAEILPPEQMPANIVTMRSVVECSEQISGARHTLTLAYPGEADIDAGRVSVLSPVGSALLGLSVGQEIDWPVSGGRSLRLHVDAIRYQPEAAGAFDR